MNNPINHNDDLESRIDALERDMKHVSKIETRIDKVEATMASKEDLADLRAEHGNMLRQILHLLQSKSY